MGLARCTSERREIMGLQRVLTTQRAIKLRVASAGLMLCAAVGQTASAGAVSLTAPSEFESSMLMLTDVAMAMTHGPTSGEGVGLLRHDTGLYPPPTIDLNLPELRSASPIAALRWSNRWREVIESVYGGDREMVDYWTQGAAAQSEPVFSVLHIGESLLNGDGSRRPAPAMRDIEQSGGGYASAISFARGSGGGGGGGGGGGQPLPPFGSFPNDITSPGDSAGPVTLPPAIPPAPAPSPVLPEEPAPGTPPRFVVSFGGLDWVNPNFNQNPPPVGDERPPNNGDSPGFAPGSPVAIPTPSAIGFGAAGLLAMAAGLRRRRLA
jgi:hypothetical protein